MGKASSCDLPIIAFQSRQAWDAWLTAQPARSKGLWLKLAKKSSGVASVSRQEAVDTALCYGWIDGQLDSFDDKYWLIRFTPRQPRSIWSEKNRARALELIELGRMRPAGLNEIERAKKDGRWSAAYAGQSTAQVPDDLRAALEKRGKAKKFFETLDSRNRYAILHRIHNAKKTETRIARIEKFVTMLAEGKTIYPLKSSL
ncbi:Uncharacterized conserved protein YdeI, YjbR/CyaY-like superfamily, DUF1801 family [Bradyrhizobium lablabi]|uniref:Uncharacterized conserved protein YdeI, YjbR/CyaY-like superfamily, DUF1801 family n=1 Tax=Bradyrhizobium lablabi TaxID=722472 RepID=A0A1M6YTW5_9BRAD|nr:YdeI/OmpD-associated family protein [Bradyrhizobium lablabi]SHL21512.1 Uncharacterized conserved protein YdeI, YjbR/CyaY-like superfamily, DUF1801 family [Bradyrhizobium lablabi]